MSELENEIVKSVELLKKGKILLYPTDTIWGIGCDATQPKAIQKIYKIKERVESKRMILLLDEVQQLKHYVKKIPDTAYDLIENATSPITIVYPGAINLPKILLAEDGSVAIRVVDGDYCKEVVKRLGKPLVSTSANASGEPSPKTFDQISENIKQKVDYVVNIHRGRIRQIKPSTLVKLDASGGITILRS